MINREATIRWKGYDPNDLKKGSAKRIWVNCDKCGKGRWVRIKDYTPLCRKCAQNAPELTEKRRLSNMGEKNGMFGKRHTEEAKEKVRVANKGRLSGSKNPNCGKTMSKEQKKKISDSHIALNLVGERSVNYGRVRTDEHRKKISDTRIRKKIGIGEKNPNWKPKVKKICGQCGIEYDKDESTADGSKFCSRPCKDAHNSGENAYNWKGGISFEPYCPKFNEAFKESIREKFNRTCFLCPTTEVENGQKLSVHHVSYDKNCLCDDVECEFVPLCSRCHAKTGNDRSYWTKTILDALLLKKKGCYNQAV